MEKEKKDRGVEGGWEERSSVGERRKGKKPWTGNLIPNNHMVLKGGLKKLFFVVTNVSTKRTRLCPSQNKYLL